MTTRKYKKSRAFRTIRLTKRGGGNCTGKLPCRDYDNELIEYFTQLRTGGTIDIETVRYLLERGAKSNGVVGVVERPLLNIAILYGYTEIVELLLEYDADPNNWDIHGNMAIHLAISMGRIEIVKMLLDKGTTHLDNINNAGQTPLDFAEQRLRHYLEYPSEDNDDQQIKISTEIVNMLKQYMISPTIKKHVKNQQSHKFDLDNVHMVAKSKNLPPEMEDEIAEYLNPKRGGKSKSKRRRTRRNKKGTRRK